MLHRVPGRLWIWSYIALIAVAHVSPVLSTIAKPAEELDVDIRQEIVKEGFIIDYETSGEASVETTSDKSTEKSTISDFIKRTLTPRQDDLYYVPPFEGKGKIHFYDKSFRRKITQQANPLAPCSGSARGE